MPQARRPKVPPPGQGAGRAREVQVVPGGEVGHVPRRSARQPGREPGKQVVEEPRALSDDEGAGGGAEAGHGEGPYPNAQADEGGVRDVVLEGVRQDQRAAPAGPKPVPAQGEGSADGRREHRAPDAPG